MIFCNNLDLAKQAGMACPQCLFEPKKSVSNHPSHLVWSDCRRFKLKSLAKDEAISSHKKIFYLRSGALRLEAARRYGRRSILAFQFPGEVLKGDIVTDLSNIKLTAIEPSIVAYLEVDDLEFLTASNPLVSMRNNALFNESMECMRLHVIELTLKSPEEKFVSMLLRMALRLGTSYSDGVIISLPLSRVDFADYLGIETETVSRVISKLRSTGYLKTNGRHEFVIRDLLKFSKLTPLGEMLFERAQRRYQSNVHPTDKLTTNPAPSAKTGCPVFDMSFNSSE